jgi:hypothetical protein
MGWYGYGYREFASYREQLEFVLKHLYGERCELVDYERIRISKREQRDGLGEQSECYLAVDFSKQYPNLGIGAVVLFERLRDKSPIYKPIEEEMGPCAFRCPTRILDKLTPSSNDQAQEWRVKCRAYHLQREQHKRQRLRRLH